MEIALLLTLIGLFIGLIGILPIIIDWDVYKERLGVQFTDRELTIDFIQITYDIISPELVNINLTGKYRVLKNDPLFYFPITTLYGNSEKFIIHIDNKEVKADIIGDSQNKKAIYNLTNKNKGDTFILDLTFKAHMNSEKIKSLEYDKMGFSCSHYRCRQMKLSIIFPEGYYPENVKFINGESFHLKNTTKEKFGMTKLPTLCINNRRCLDWLVKYPKFKTGYWIKWKWA